MSRRFASRYSFTRPELVMVCRIKGWNGKASGTSVQQFGDWLKAQGMTPVDIRATLDKAMGKGAAPDASAAVGPSRDEIQDMIAAAGGGTGAVDLDVLRKMVAEEISKAQPARIIVDTGAKTSVVMKERTHPLFEKVLRLAKIPGMNILLVGPAGCGKTHLASQLAKAMKRKYGTLHCTAGASESQLIGWLLPVGASGKFEYVPAEFVRLYEEGDSVFLLDEIDAADPNMLLVLNGAMANGALHVPQRHKDPHIGRGKNVTIIAAANTYGTGADMMYAGRNQLDSATLDRFYVIQMDYDAGYESELCGAPITVDPWQVAEAPDEEELANLAAWVRSLRAAVAKHRLRRVVSTRTLQKALAARKALIPTAEIKLDIMAGWTRDELAKVEVM